MELKNITFNDIEPIWRQHLWPTRTSPIESHSAMTWPFEGDPNQYDISVFDYPATFVGAYHNGELVGVNSGHRTTKRQYRCRGIWVHPDYRNQRIAQQLYQLLEDVAISEGCEMMWCIPRKSSLGMHMRFGFNPVGDYIKTETSDANIYVYKWI